MLTLSNLLKLLVVLHPDFLVLYPASVCDLGSRSEVLEAVGS